MTTIDNRLSHDFASLAEAWAFCRASDERGDLTSEPLVTAPYTVRVIETAAERCAMAESDAGAYHDVPERSAARAENALQREHGLPIVWQTRGTEVRPLTQYERGVP